MYATMPGSTFLSQLSNTDGYKSSLHTGNISAVPEAPTFSGIPDIDLLLGGDNPASLLDLQPSQWLPSTQTQAVCKPVSRTDKPSGDKIVSEKGDGDDVNLGSQFPLIHSIVASQLPARPSQLPHGASQLPTSASQILPHAAQLPTGPSWRNNNKKYTPPGNRNNPTNSRVQALPKRKFHLYNDRLAEGPSRVQQKMTKYDGSERDLFVEGSRTPSVFFEGSRTPSVFVEGSRIPSVFVEGSRIPSVFVEGSRTPSVFVEGSRTPSVFVEGSRIPSVFVEGSRTPAVTVIPTPHVTMDELYTPSVQQVQPMLQHQGGIRLRSVTEIAQKFHEIFRFSHFNMVQSKVFDDVMYTDKSLVLCSPTGSGKTAVFEMAIVRLLSTQHSQNMKVVYMAPIKALCSERFSDWKEKFEAFNLRVMELTGDTDNDDFFQLQQVNIILTTPEKWDSMTRKWRDNKTVMQSICLFLVDEIHVLNDPTRGAVVEAVISRMKTIQAARQRTVTDKDIPELRFVALSATITNIEDIAHWLGSEKSPALNFKFDESARPVRLRKVVLGYHFSEGKRSEFQFDISLSYKLAGIINTYNENKPSLIFCATRKGVMQAADILAKDVKSSYLKNAQHRLILQNHSFHLKDTKLRDLVSLGIGYHHAGMDIQDRKGIEDMFANGELPVLVATSTLAMGVNLPAHLVIVKSTMYYNMGGLQEYSDTQVLQMIGRAGRPQFDTSATAVIMTKNTTKTKYENLINGTQLIESSLHKNLVEHLNAEIVLNTITDISVAVEWLKYTFLYIRVMKNPVHYGIPCGLAKVAIERRLQDLCMKSLNQLNSLNLIDMNGDNLDVKPTDSGRLMARYCISFKTAQLFLGLKGDESISDLIVIISKCEEFEDIKLRMNEKTALNTLNKDKNRITIRYPMTGKIKTTDMKVNCLIQATLGCLLIHDFALQQDTARIFKAGVRVTRCLVELVSQKKNYKAVLSALLLCKCFKSKLWENSKYVSKQLEGIGPTLSTALVNAGLTSFEKMEQTNPREIELMANRHPPFGNQVRDSINKLPKYELTIEQIARYSIDRADIVLTITLTNRDKLKDVGSSCHACTLLLADEDNVVLYRQWIMDAVLMKETSWSKKFEIKLAAKGPLLNIHYISQDFVGLDVECTYTPYYHAGFKVASSARSGQQMLQVQPKDPVTILPTRQPCNHACHNKMLCAHECCKTGVTTKRRKQQTESTPKPVTTKGVQKHLDEIRQKSSCLPVTPQINKRAKLQERDMYDTIDLTRYSYQPRSYNNICNMYTDPPVDVEDYQSGYTEEDQYMKDVQHNQYGQRLKDQQLQDLSKAGSNSTKAVKQNSNPKHNKPSNRDWDRLDMYIKNRGNSATTEAEYDDDEVYETYPDIEHSYLSLPDIDPPGPHIECDDIAQETDYGIVYVQAGDQTSTAADMVDEEMKEQRQGIHHEWNGKSLRTTSPREALKTQQQRNMNSDNRSQSTLHGMRNMSHNKPSATLQGMRRTSDGPSHLIQGLGGMSEVDYEIEDFNSDESFEAAQQSEADCALNAWQELRGNYTTNYASNISPSDVEYGYYGNIQGNHGDTFFSDDFDYEGQLYAKPLVNKPSVVQEKLPARVSKPLHSFDRRQPVQHNQQYGTPLTGRYKTTNDNMEVNCKENVQQGQPGQINRLYGLYGLNNEDYIATDLLVPEDHTESTDQGSKWTTDLLVPEDHTESTDQGSKWTTDLLVPEDHTESTDQGSKWTTDLLVPEDHTESTDQGSKWTTDLLVPEDHTESTDQGSKWTTDLLVPEDHTESTDPGSKWTTDLLVPEDHTESRDQGSKWTNYFSSQSSTASDCVNLKYPSKTDNNEMVMKTWNCSQTGLTNSSINPAKFPYNYRSDDQKGMAAETFNVPTRKFGQVLACVSNQGQQEKESYKPHGNNTTSHDVNSYTRSEAGYPDYSNIFEDIL